MAICTSIVKLEEITPDTDMLLVTIDDDVQAYMVYNYAQCLQFVNQDVIVSYRKDVYKGKIENFINTLTIPVKVTALDRDDNIKLFVKQHDNNSNCCLSDIKEGESFVKAILYCVESQYESSVKAVWLTLTVRDKAGRVAKLRLFDYDSRDANYSGMYIRANIKRTKYGFNTDMIEPVDIEFSPNPEIEISKKFIQITFLDDNYIKGVLASTKLLERMETFVDVEMGFALVRLAVELDILEELKNVLDDVDFKAISYALVMRYGYIAKQSLKRFSNRLKSVTFALQQNMPTSVATKVLMILDEDCKEVELIPEKDVFNSILLLADSVIKAKKAVE
ncbi:MAG: hypothetical protein NC131_15620 [Roseburia sp.]|nr:hypothetical protein [Roseburia sp.]